MSDHEGNDAATTATRCHEDDGTRVNQLIQPPATTSSDVSEQEEKKDADNPSEPAAMQRGFRFWAIIASLCVTGLLSSLENTVVTTSLPTIVRELNVGDNYIWITNVFFLTRYGNDATLHHAICQHITPHLILHKSPWSETTDCI